MLSADGEYELDRARFWAFSGNSVSGSNEVLAETLSSARFGASLEVAPLPANGQARGPGSHWESVPLHAAAGSRLDDGPDPATLRCTLEEKQRLEVGCTSTITIKITDQNLDPCSVTCMADLRSLVANTLTECSVVSTDEPGTYKVTCTPQIRGRHNLSISVNSFVVKRSPFYLFVNYPPQLLKKPVRVIEGLGSPHAVTITKTSEIVVSEWDMNRISTFTEHGRKIREFGCTGRGEGEFIYPWGVASDEEFIYVADSFNNRIQKFTCGGRFVKEVGSLGNNPGQFNVPTTIRLNKENQLYVCDTNNRRIQILDDQLKYVSCFGSRGTAPGQFWTPQSLAFDVKGNVFIADHKNNNIQVFTPKGEFMYQFGGKGSKEGKLNGPIGVCIDHNDLVYVTEWENYRVSIFDTSGNFVTSFGSKGAKPGQFSHPSGVAIDRDGFVYVCDYDARNGCVQVF